MASLWFQSLHLGGAPLTWASPSSPAKKQAARLFPLVAKKSSAALLVAGGLGIHTALFLGPRFRAPGRAVGAEGQTLS